MKKPPFMRGPYNYDLDEASNSAVIPADQQGESLTIQSQTEDADINVMMKRFGVAGKMPEGVRIPIFDVDFSGSVRDFQTAMNAIVDAEEAFMEFPPEIRSRFKNSPQLMMEFCDVADNWEEAKKLGILSDEAIKARVAAADAARAARQSELLEAAKAAGWAPKEPAPGST